MQLYKLIYYIRGILTKTHLDTCLSPPSEIEQHHLDTQYPQSVYHKL